LAKNGGALDGTTRVSIYIARLSERKPRCEARQSDDSQQPASEKRSQKEQPSNRPAAVAAVVRAIANYEDA